MSCRAGASGGRVSHPAGSPHKQEPVIGAHWDGARARAHSHSHATQRINTHTTASLAGHAAHGHDKVPGHTSDHLEHHQVFLASSLLLFIPTLLARRARRRHCSTGIGSTATIPTFPSNSLSTPTSSRHCSPPSPRRPSQRVPSPTTRRPLVTHCHRPQSPPRLLPTPTLLEALLSRKVALIVADEDPS